MKKIILITVLVIVFISCSDNSNNSSPLTVAPILGEWQYVEYLDYNPPGPYLINDGIIIDLNSDGTFSTSNQNVNFQNGTYNVSQDSIITFNYISNTETNIVKKKILSYSASGMILDNDYLQSGACIEGCAERYEKINTP